VPETTEHQALRAAVRGLVAQHQAELQDETYDLRLWQRLCSEIGVAGLAVPDRFGGSGAGPVEVHIVQEELGRALAGTPMLGSAVLATEALIRSGDEAACARLLPGLAAGSAIAALAWTTAAGRWDPAEVACRAAPAADGSWVIDGAPQFVLDGDAASTLLVPAKMPAGIGLFEVPPAQAGVTCSRCTTMDQSRRLAVVRLTDATGRRIGGLAALERAGYLGCIAPPRRPARR
jgi:alkylation response protein AidB-like acyl-CoA dehydrogenase